MVFPSRERCTEPAIQCAACLLLHVQKYDVILSDAPLRHCKISRAEQFKNFYTYVLFTYIVTSLKFYHRLYIENYIHISNLNLCNLRLSSTAEFIVKVFICAIRLWLHKVLLAIQRYRIVSHVDRLILSDSMACKGHVTPLLSSPQTISRS